MDSFLYLHCLLMILIFLKSCSGIWILEYSILLVDIAKWISSIWFFVSKIVSRFASLHSSLSLAGPPIQEGKQRFINIYAIIIRFARLDKFCEPDLEAPLPDFHLVEVVKLELIIFHQAYYAGTDDFILFVCVSSPETSTASASTVE